MICITTLSESVKICGLQLVTFTFSCLSSTAADGRGNPYATKQWSDQEIDAAIALMMAIGRAMTEDQNDKNLDGFLSNPLSF